MDDIKKTTISKTAKNSAATYGMVVMAFIIVQILLTTGHVSSLMKGLLVPLCIHIITTVSLSLTVSIPEELDLGHAGFMCVGAFVSSFFSVCMKNTMTSVGLRFLLALLIGTTATAVANITVSTPVFRLQDGYLAIVTLAFGEIIRDVVNVIYLGRDSVGFHVPVKNSMKLNMLEDDKVITNGAQGITDTPDNSTFVIDFALILIILLIVLSPVHSGSDRVITATRDNRIVAEPAGINITKRKLMVFTIPAFLADAASVLYSHNLSALMVAQKNLGYNQPIMILAFVVLGGIGNIRDSVIAAVTPTLFPELLHRLNGYRMLIYIIVLITVMIFNWSPAIVDLRKRYSFRQVFGKKKTAKKVQ